MPAPIVDDTSWNQLSTPPPASDDTSWDQGDFDDFIRSRSRRTTKCLRNRRSDDENLVYRARRVHATSAWGTHVAGTDPGYYDAMVVALSLNEAMKAATAARGNVCVAASGTTCASGAECPCGSCNVLQDLVDDPNESCDPCCACECYMGSVCSHAFKHIGGNVCMDGPTGLGNTFVPCTKFATEGWHSGTLVGAFGPSDAPNGQEWAWQQCAAECAKSAVEGGATACDFWTLQRTNMKQCLLFMDPPGTSKAQRPYNDQASHFEGDRKISCLGTDECSKFATAGWHEGHYAATLWPMGAPNAIEWTWQQCAAECAKATACDFWTLQLAGDKKCLLMTDLASKAERVYHDEDIPTHPAFEGDRQRGCLGTAATAPLTSGEEEAEALDGNVLIGVGATTLVQLCRLMEADDLEAIGAALGQTIEGIQAMGAEDVLGWASRCAQLASQDDVDALPVQPAAKIDVSWAQGMIAVCVLLFVVGKLAAFLFTPGRPQAAEDPGEDDKGDDEGDDEDADEAEAHVETEI